MWIAVPQQSKTPHAQPKKHLRKQAFRHRQVQLCERKHPRQQIPYNISCLICNDLLYFCAKRTNPVVPVVCPHAQPQTKHLRKQAFRHRQVQLCERKHPRHPTSPKSLISQSCEPSSSQSLLSQENKNSQQSAETIILARSAIISTPQE